MCASGVRLSPIAAPSLASFMRPLIRQFRENSRAGQPSLHARRAVNFQPPIPLARFERCRYVAGFGSFRERYGHAAFAPRRYDRFAATGIEHIDRYNAIRYTARS
jgi:hypothetical protein